LSLIGALDSNVSLVSEGKNGNVVQIQRSRCLLNDGAVIILDNTLWKGLVLAHDNELAKYAPRPEEYGKPERMKNMAKIMHDFNQFLVNASFEVVTGEESWLDGVDDVLSHATEKFKENEGFVTMTTAETASQTKKQAFLQVALLPLRDGLTVVQLKYK